MRTEPVTSAKNKLSALLREVRAGRTIVITDRGVPVAELRPPRAATGISPRWVEAAQAGRVSLPGREPDHSWLTLPLPTLKPGAPDVVDQLIEDREDRV